MIVTTTFFGLYTDLKTLWRSHPRALSGFVLAAAVTLFFAVRFVASVLYWHDPAHIHEPVKPWMTIGYVAKSWGLRGPDIDAAAGLPKPKGGHPFTIHDIALQRGVPEAEIMKLVEDTVAMLVAAQDAQRPKP